MVSTLPYLPGRAWTPEAIARRVRDEAMMRQVRAGRSPYAPQLPKWLRDASPFNA